MYLTLFRMFSELDPSQVSEDRRFAVSERTSASHADIAMLTAGVEVLWSVVVQISSTLRRTLLLRSSSTLIFLFPPTHTSQTEATEESHLDRFIHGARAAWSTERSRQCCALKDVP